MELAGEPPAELFAPGVPAVPERLAELRDTVAEWVAALGVSGAEHSDIVLATYEAMANVVAHAYPDAPGVFDLHACVRADRILVTVTDYGRWHDSVSDSAMGGRGLPLIRALAAESDIATDSVGTRVSMTWPAATFDSHSL